MIIVEVFAQGGSFSNVASMSDVAGDTFSRCGTLYNGGTTSYFDVWYAANITGHASQAITPVYTGTPGYALLAAQEFSHLSTCRPSQGDNFISGSVSTITSSTMSPTAASDLIIGLAYLGSGAAAPTSPLAVITGNSATDTDGYTQMIAGLAGATTFAGTANATAPDNAWIDLVAFH
jgi:hypothetical protein